MTEILIGTSGYYYQDWVGPFYPSGTGKEHFLSFYSRHFPFCELNFSYYQMPARGKLLAMINQTPPGFQFAIKAHKSITHERGPGSMEQAEEFFHAVRPMQDEKRLAAVLLQFPYSFHYSPENRRYLAEILKPLEGLPLCVEFRNREWMLERYMTGLQNDRSALYRPTTPSLTTFRCRRQQQHRISAISVFTEETATTGGTATIQAVMITCTTNMSCIRGSAELTTLPERLNAC